MAVLSPPAMELLCASLHDTCEIATAASLNSLLLWCTFTGRCLSCPLLPSGDFKLADFGLARAFGSPDVRLTNQVSAGWVGWIRYHLQVASLLSNCTRHTCFDSHCLC